MARTAMPNRASTNPLVVGRIRARAATKDRVEGHRPSGLWVKERAAFVLVVSEYYLSESDAETEGLKRSFAVDASHPIRDVACAADGHGADRAVRLDYWLADFDDQLTLLTAGVNAQEAFGRDRLEVRGCVHSNRIPGVARLDGAEPSRGGTPWVLPGGRALAGEELRGFRLGNGSGKRG